MSDILVLIALGLFGAAGFVLIAVLLWEMIVDAARGIVNVAERMSRRR